MRRSNLTWRAETNAGLQLDELLTAAAEVGIVHLRFDEPSGGLQPPWERLDRLHRTRGVTVADVSTPLGGGALEVALSCDLLLVRPRALLEPPAAPEVPGPVTIRAFGRAGPAALRRLMLDPGPIGPGEALELGVAAWSVGAEEPLPIPPNASLTALTAARDLLRTEAGRESRLALELATFRLLFAAGEPQEGAAAFLDNRDPEFGRRSS